MDTDDLIYIFILCFFIYGCFVNSTQDINDNYYIYENDAMLVGADWNPLLKINNNSAKNITYNELKQFIHSDKTDEIEYNHSNFTCGDYSELVHNNAEQQGISAGMVSIDFIFGEGHMFNIFNTTDRGVIYVDCTEHDSYVDSFEVGSTMKYKNNEYYMDGIISEIWIYW